MSQKQKDLQNIKDALALDKKATGSLTIGFDFSPTDEKEVQLFKDILFEMITNDILCGKNSIYHEQKLSMTFEGELTIIRKNLLDWFPNFKDDKEWEEALKVSQEIDQG